MNPLLSIAVLALLSAGNAQEPDSRPNIVWIFVDDMSPNFSCYGESTIQTPNVDRMAENGIRFTRAFVTAPVCSACRSALITGCYQTTIGAHNHRSGRGKIKIHLPDGIVPVPALFQKAGYYTCIGSPPLGKGKRLGKTDYNFEWDPSIYDGNDWSGRKPGQPFFMQVELHGGKYRGQGLDPQWEKRVAQELGDSTKPADVELPPYYPRDPAILRDWARYLDTVRYTDKEVGDIIQRLDDEGLLFNTVVFFMTDHGISHARGKQFLYDEGIHVPFVIQGPGIEAAKVRTDLVEHIDMTATSLALAGIDIPDWMQGRNIFAEDYKPREAIYAARDRCDETVDHIRAVRTEQFAYIRNYLNQRPLLQPNRYKDDKLILRRLRDLHSQDQLNELQNELLFSPTRQPEELYDVVADPYETNNLVGKPEYQDVLDQMRKRLITWEEQTNDQGRELESEEEYDSDMDVYVGNKKGPGPNILRHNIQQMKQWAQEGK